MAEGFTQARAVMTGGRGGPAGWLPALLLLWCAGLYLRMPIMMTAPLGPIIAGEFGLGKAGLGALTTLPVLMFSLGAMTGALVMTWLGARQGVMAGLVVIGLASAARGWVAEPWQLHVAGICLGMGIAVLQPALAGLLVRWPAAKIALATGIYMNGFLLGEVLGAGATLPVLLPAVGGDWRWVFAVVSLPALLVAAAFLIWPATPPEAARGLPLRALRRPLVLLAGVTLGGAGAVFLGVNAYMGTVLTLRGEEALLAPGLLLFNAAQLLASALLMRWSHRWVARVAPLGWSVLIMLLGTLLFLYLPGWAGLVAAFAVSFASALILILVMSLPPLLAGDEGAGAFAAGVYTVAYALSFSVPLLGGALVDVLGLPVLVFAPCLALLLLSLALLRPLARALEERREPPVSVSPGDLPGSDRVPPGPGHR